LFILYLEPRERIRAGAGGILQIIILKSTNYFSVHYLKIEKIVYIIFRTTRKDSRGSGVEEIVNMVAVAVVDAQEKIKEKEWSPNSFLYYCNDIEMS
jgi:hypothetical protein